MTKRTLWPGFRARPTSRLRMIALDQTPSGYDMLPSVQAACDPFFTKSQCIGVLCASRWDGLLAEA